MPLTFEKLHPHFAAEVGPIDLRRVHDPKTLAEIRAGMDEYAVLVFRDQPFADDEQIAFAQRLDGELHTKTGSSALKKSRLGNEALGDISNVDENGDLLQVRRPAPHVRPRQSPLAHGRLVPGPAGPLLDAVGAHHPARRRGYRVRRHAGGLRRPARLDEGHRSRACASITPSPTRARRSASSSRRKKRRSSWARCTRSRARSPAPIGDRSTWPPTPRRSWTGPCPRGVSCCTT